jgi:outer membrane receptor protein involved in Fe transport
MSSFCKYLTTILFLLAVVPSYVLAEELGEDVFGIPIESIESVEIIRGPGAAYYGTNATGGVIKVVPRKGNGEQDNRLSSSVGSHGLVRGSSYLGQQVNPDLYWSAAMELQRDDGYDGYFDSSTPVPSSYPADTPTRGDVNKKEEIASFLGQLQYRDTHFLVGGRYTKQ